MSRLEHMVRREKSGYVRPFNIKLLALTAVLCVALAAYINVFAGEGGLLSTSSTEITADSSCKFTLNLGSISDEIAEDSGGYEVNLEVSPAPGGLALSEGTGTVSGAKFRAHISDASRPQLHFTLTPDAAITADTVYNVSVTVTGSTSGETISDSFSVTVKTANQSQGGEGGDDPGQNNNQNNNQNMNQNMNKNMGKGNMGKMSGGTSSYSVSGSVSTDSASTTYAGSWDNYLDALAVEGYEFTREFNKTRDTYFLSVPHDVTELDVAAEASDSSAIVAISGDDDLATGMNKVMINVTADDGSVRVYRIYVTREA